VQRPLVSLVAGLGHAVEDDAQVAGLGRLAAGAALGAEDSVGVAHARRNPRARRARRALDAQRVALLADAVGRRRVHELSAAAAAAAAAAAGAAGAGAGARRALDER
jgi:hypothetical protein